VQFGAPLAPFSFVAFRTWPFSARLHSAPHNDNGGLLGVTVIEPTSNVVAFKRRNAHSPSRRPKTLIEAVYAAGSITVPADDLAVKTAAVMLQALGFLIVDAISADGTARRLSRSEAKGALDRPWRLSKPAFAGESGLPDADGAFIRPV
jgi:hypothetical protein